MTFNNYTIYIAQEYSKVACFYLKDGKVEHCGSYFRVDFPGDKEEAKWKKGVIKKCIEDGEKMIQNEGVSDPDFEIIEYREYKKLIK